jgi:hypothetical protein
MKKILLASLILSGVELTAQISLTQSDMPNVGDSVRVSYAAFTSLPAGGPNVTWDYSFLVPNSQYVFHFANPSSTSYFGLNNTFLSSYAVYNWSPDSIPFVPILPTDFFDFYKESSTYFKQVGQGYSLFGFPIPVFYNPQDPLYKFPLDFGDIDTSDAQFISQIPTIFYWKENIHRVNTYSGWGALRTPYDTFPSVCLVKAELTLVDSFSLDTFGISLPPITRYENQYKWFATGSKIPLLQINTNLNLGNETVTNVIYRDTVRPVLQIGIGENDKLSGFSIFPNPATEQLNFVVSAGSPSSAVIAISDLNGRLIWSENMQLQPGKNSKSLNLSSLKIAKGVYVVTLTSNKSFEAKKIVIQ